MLNDESGKAAGWSGIVRRPKRTISRGTESLQRRLGLSQSTLARILLYPIDGLLQKLWIATMAVMLAESRKPMSGSTPTVRT